MNSVFGKQMVATRTIADGIGSSKEFEKFIYNCLRLFGEHDWGDLCEEDKKQNDEAVKHGERILASYNFPKDVQWIPDDINDKCIWIITEWDRSVTTLLLPSEY